MSKENENNKDEVSKKEKPTPPPIRLVTETFSLNVEKSNEKKKK